MPQDTMPETGFEHMPLSTVVQSAVRAAGYETPTPIQAKAIPLLARGNDLIGQAKTGTGKTAAFALPLLSKIDLDLKKPQVLILTPTRELAIQVADAFKTYGKGMKGLSVLPVYGGQSYGIQLNRLKQGVHVIVGTPGRLMDHIQRKTISLAHLFCKILDEADEMLHMGFIDDVEWIFKQTPEQTQTALFSATMPGPIRKIAQTYLTDPEEIILRSQSIGVENISQKFWLVKGCSKAAGLPRLLDATNFDGVIVFVKTKSSTLDVSKNLEDNGFRAEALNGDMAQAAREKTVNRLKNGHIDILVATDVAARGLDVDRISHVINYDMPDKTEPYIHRIGRTGRAGRKGDALLFIYPKERWMVRKLEKATGQKIEQTHLPTNKAINEKRINDFKAAITRTLASEDLDVFQDLVTAYAEEENVPVAAIAAALGKLAHGDTPFLLDKKEPKKQPAAQKQESQTKKPKTRREKLARKSAAKKEQQPVRSDAPRPLKKGMDRYRIEVGRTHGVKARDIVGAISNEAGLESKFITGVTIKKDFSVVDLPAGMPKDIFRLLKKTWVRSRPMDISRMDMSGIKMQKVA
ncbi:MAG: DEAD/DEAH box helicase [Desulfobacterales bacterium]|nr:DEAD/DEAH box helicase [Desulfobacterales bacterium]